MKKIGDSFKGVIVGVILIIIGVVLLWWNEGNNVKNLKTTAELEDVYVDVKSDSIDSKNEGKLVAVSGKLLNEQELTDSKFGVTIKTPILKRKVEMYQWEEKSEADDNDNEKYTYDKVWDENIIDSSDFHSTGHENPIQKTYDNKVYSSNNVKVGAFSLAPAQIKKLSTKGTFSNFDENKINELGLNISNKYITSSSDLENPKIGDIRISFDYNDSTEISILAVQKGNSFKVFTSKAGKKVNRVMDGTLSGKEMIDAIKAENNFLKWILRFVGTLLCILGIAIVLNPISTIFGFIPILGNVVGMAIGLVSFALGLALSLIIIAIAWIRFRPIVGISLLVIASILIVFLIMKGKKSNNSNQLSK